MKTTILISFRRPRDTQRGFTLTELMVGMVAGLLIAGSMMLLLIQSAREQYRGVADATVEEVTATLQTEIIRCLRGMSANEGVVFSSPATNSGAVYQGFQRVVMAHGPVPDYPREDIRFDPQAGTLTYDPNLTITGNERVFLQSRTNAFMLRNVCFFPSLKPDGSLDNSLVNVVIELDDNRSSRRPGLLSSPSYPARVQRTFAVKMRNH
jgi:prepilin-type N-terminal cleavage/methylation domain-containing protein